jgi:ribosomal protein S18 acetylase RimI-like enzyme
VSLDGRRLEALSLNSSAPPGQLLYDGWLLRFAPGKAKRARSVNAVYPSRLPLEEKIAHCERLYAQAGLPAIFRITPFSQPGELDAVLERRGYGRFDETVVESAPLEATGSDPGRTVEMPLAEWIDAVARLRGAPPGQQAGHRARLESCPLDKIAVALHRDGSVVATGLAILEEDAVGLFDIATHAAYRRQGLAREVVAGLLARSGARGARHAYLQVDAANTPARNLYARFGFVERYRYFYRGRPGEQA